MPARAFVVMKLLWFFLIFAFENEPFLPNSAKIGMSML